MKADIHAIAAIGKNGEIGIKGDLIWKISDDLKHFKTITTGHPVIMGRKTWESLPKKPLPGRKNIVLSRNKDFQPEGASKVNSIEEAIDLCRDEVPFIIGGEEIYKSFMRYVTVFHVTHIDEDAPGADAFLKLNSREWEIFEESPLMTSPDSIKYQFRKYRRVEEPDLDKI